MIVKGDWKYELLRLLVVTTMTILIVSAPPTYPSHFTKTFFIAFGLFYAFDTIAKYCFNNKENH